ncbi:MAG: rRNA (guanine527-N7)-methyltransferase [Gaiellaceae bacterium]|nr:rRNA (guanine527-N7)-methyltransferase [Gaiellaceae bacterium]
MKEIADDPRLEAWFSALLATPGLTALRGDREAAWRELVEDSLTGLELVASFDGPVVDVGSGGGVPGIPLALALPDREVTLLEASGRKCAFLRDATAALANVTVVQGRAEEQEPERFGVAVGKALAPPAVAAEWLLPLVAVGGAAIVYAGHVQGDLNVVAAALGAAPPEAHPVATARDRSLLVFRKIAPTPAGFPRRVGVARKRPLG